ncbi:MAG: hypothetical protein MJ239_02145 [Bacilli bacterium]|nr:hypothetical protein [Bacilli bacterium]
MNSKKKILVLLSSLLLATAATATVATTALQPEGRPYGIQAGDECASHTGNHYAMKDPTNTEPGYREFWACCVCGRQYLTQKTGDWTEGSAATMIGSVDSDHIAYLPVGLKIPFGENDWGLKQLSSSFAKTDYADKAIQFKAYFGNSGDSQIQISLYNGNDELKPAITDIRIYQTGGKYSVKVGSIDLEAACTKVDEHTVLVKLNYSRLLNAGAIATENSFNYIRVWPMAEVTTPGCGVFTNSFSVVDPYVVEHKYSFHTAESIENMVTEEGENLWIGKDGIGSASGAICTLDPAGTHEGQIYNGSMCFNDLKGVSKIKLKGTGKILVQTGLVAWTWETSSVFDLNTEEGITMDIDPERTNAFLLASRGTQVVLTSLEIVSRVENGTGSTDMDLFQNATIANWGNESYGYYTASNTNGSKSALVVGSMLNYESWPAVPLILGGVDATGCKLEFDAKGTAGRKRISITPFGPGDVQLGPEIGYDLTNSWQKITYDNWTVDDRVVNFIRITVFTTPESDVHEAIIDNMKFVDKSIINETGAPAWSYRAFDATHVLTESQYFNKALAIDFKPETTNASFEIDYMSDSNHYVGRKNFITVADGVPTSTFGTIVANPTAGEGWYTLLVSEKNIGHFDRVTNGATIAGMYLATDNAMTGSVTFNYHSFRAVDDIAPTRQILTYTQNGFGVGFGHTDVNHVANVSHYRTAAGNTIMISLKVVGSVGSYFTMNFAPQGDPNIFKYIIITVTETGLASNCGKIEAAPDGFYNFYLPNTECDQDALTDANGDCTCSVFWMGEPFTGVEYVQIDANACKIYQAGIVA